MRGGAAVVRSRPARGANRLSGTGSIAPPIQTYPNGTVSRKQVVRVGVSAAKISATY